jgi:phospholipase/lecithinase/hemolysin
MIRKFLPRAAFALTACLSPALLRAAAANAADFSAEYVFGDSLSDNGNLAAGLHTTFPNPPSFNNSFTNGSVAVQLLAESLGLTANASLWLTAPSVPAGTNYAVGGATSATPDAVGINLLNQVGAYSTYAAGHADRTRSMSS